MFEFLQPYYTVIALILIALVLLVGAAMIIRSFNGRVRGRRGSRLGISEYYELDKTRRLVLVRRDDVEHLMLVGGPQDVVIESSIPTEAMSQPQIPPPPEAPQLRAAPRPAVFGASRPPLRPVSPGFQQNDHNL
jgi:flagellar protein FliO/FliZ